MMIVETTANVLIVEVISFLVTGGLIVLFYHLGHRHGVMDAKANIVVEWVKHERGRLFTCRCGRTLGFSEELHYWVARTDPQTHEVTAARYVLICECGLGHWIDLDAKNQRPKLSLNQRVAHEKKIIT